MLWAREAHRCRPCLFELVQASTLTSAPPGSTSVVGWAWPGSLSPAASIWSVPRVERGAESWPRSWVCAPSPRASMFEAQQRDAGRLERAAQVVSALGERVGGGGVVGHHVRGHAVVGAVQLDPDRAERGRRELDPGLAEALLGAELDRAANRLDRVLERDAVAGGGGALRGLGRLRWRRRSAARSWGRRTRRRLPRRSLPALAAAAVTAAVTGRPTAGVSLTVTAAARPRKGRGVASASWRRPGRCGWWARLGCGCGWSGPAGRRGRVGWAARRPAGSVRWSARGRRRVRGRVCRRGRSGLRSRGGERRRRSLGRRRALARGGGVGQWGRGVGQGGGVGQGRRLRVAFRGDRRRGDGPRAGGGR